MNTCHDTPWTKVATVSPLDMAGAVTLPDDLPDDLARKAARLFAVLESKRPKNALRRRYYEGRNKLKDLGISTPPQILHMADLEMVVGWPQRAVDALAVRSRFDGFSADDGEVQAVLDDIVDRSDLKSAYAMAMQDELINSCSFATVSTDDMGGARIQMYDAEQAAAVWDRAKMRIAYGLTVDVEDDGVIEEATVHTDEGALHLYGDRQGFYDWDFEPYAMGRPAMECFAYRPTGRRPFGISRISRAVRSLTDSAVRVALGGDISYQFAVAPQKYLLNSDHDPRDGRTLWEAYIGSIFAISNDAGNSAPVYGQLAQASMQQTVDYMRLLASRFSSETYVPLHQLGVTADANPTSSDAIKAANEPLIVEAETLNDGARRSLKSLALMALAAERDVPLSDLDQSWRDFSVSMRSPSMPSAVSQADAAVKIAAAVPDFAGTPTFWEMVGFDEDARRRIESEVAGVSASNVFAAMLSGGADGSTA